jgi:hypothetical protein
MNRLTTVAIATAFVVGSFTAIPAAATTATADPTTVIAELRQENAALQDKLTTAIAVGKHDVTEIKIKYNKLAKKFNSRVSKNQRVALLPFP